MTLALSPLTPFVKSQFNSEIIEDFRIWPGRVANGSALWWTASAPPILLATVEKYSFLRYAQALPNLKRFVITRQAKFLITLEASHREFVFWNANNSC